MTQYNYQDQFEQGAQPYQQQLQQQPQQQPQQLAGQFAQRFQLLAGNIERIIRGKHEAIELALVCLFSEGHLLVEDVPGTGKTTLARCVAASVDAEWRRIQFTPDLLPSDITGVSIFNQAHQKFEFHHGPVFANIVLADEINRASPKTQAALLEVMEERRVTVDAEPHPVPRPFLVVATQNPVDMDGTYPLPEAQLDRFLMKISVGYPDHASEVEVLKGMPTGPQVERLPVVARASDVAGMIDFASRIHVADPVYDYIVALCGATRTSAHLRLGASPRGSLALLRAARVKAAAAGRHFVVPEDVKALAVPVLAHRLILTPEAELREVTAAVVLGEILAGMPVPQAA
ncbi:AAA family ATPase [Nonomuraea insulae]|uniref:AAA family ATPase n=1 Tax=Nonomuraea insulae TaxID=1616787 RepID=A0ABW1CVJ4_9ACTN